MYKYENYFVYLLLLQYFYSNLLHKNIMYNNIMNNIVFKEKNNIIFSNIDALNESKISYIYSKNTQILQKCKFQKLLKNKQYEFITETFIETIIGFLLEQNNMKYINILNHSHD